MILNKTCIELSSDTMANSEAIADTEKYQFDTLIRSHLLQTTASLTPFVSYGNCK